MLVDLLPDKVRNFEGWQQRHYDPAVGLYWQTGHDDGMEFNINSRQTKDILRGAKGYRPTLNAYLYADAKAIAKVARLAENKPLPSNTNQHAEQIKQFDPQKAVGSKPNLLFSSWS